MKASELIIALQKAIEEHGDLEMFMYYDSGHKPLEDDSPYLATINSWNRGVNTPFKGLAVS